MIHERYRAVKTCDYLSLVVRHICDVGEIDQT